MDSPPAALAFAFLFLFLILLFLCYRKAMKKVEGFPFNNIVLKIACDKITGKIPKDIPLSSYVFHTLINICNGYLKEGLLMTYLTQPTLFIFSAEITKFFSNEKAALDKSPEYEYIEEYMGAGIGTSNGMRWKSHRKIINPAFTMGALKDKVPLFNEHALALVRDMENLAGKSSEDILDALKCNYFNSLSESVFGLKQSEENRAKIVKIFHAVDRLSHAIVKQIVFPWYRSKFLLNILPFGRQNQNDSKECKSFITNVINDMKNHVAVSGTMEKRNPVNTGLFSDHFQQSLTYILLRQHLNDPSSFTFQDIHDEVSTIMVTGYDTVTYTTLWCLFLLALHPEVQEKAFNNVQETTTDGYVTFEDSCKLTYLEAVIMETLRIYPTVPVFSRNLSEDVQFGKFKVHKDTTIAFLSYILHRNADVYPNPEKFEPERFLNGESAKWTFIPFAEGSRSCIGKKYAIMQLKIFLAHILHNFQISTLDRREDIKLCWTVALTPARPIRMKITQRNG